MGDGGPVKFSFFSVVKYRLKSISDIAKTQYILVFFRQPVFNAYPMRRRPQGFSVRLGAGL